MEYCALGEWNHVLWVTDKTYIQLYSVIGRNEILCSGLQIKLAVLNYYFRQTKGQEEEDNYAKACRSSI